MFQNIFKFISVVFLLTVFTPFVLAQTTLISPTGDGGFENGGTPAANGWTAVNAATDSWVVGIANPPGPSAGTNAGYVSTDGGTTWAYSQTSTILHLYKDFTLPLGESKMTLSFKWKVGGEGTSDWDNLKVFIAPSTIIPVQGTAIGSTYQAGATFYNLNSASWNSATNVNVIGVPGTTYRLIFSWKSDGSTIANPPAAIDEVSLISSAPAPLVGGNIYPINGTQNPPTSFASITTAIAYMASDGITGTGQVVFELNTGYAGEPGPVFINAIPGTSATLGVTFRPALGYTALTSIAGAATPNQHAIKLNACSYVTLDGRAGGIGTSRDWTVRVTGSGTTGLGQMAVRMDNTNGNMTGNTVKYLIMEGEAANATGAIFQITGGSTYTISNIIIENNLIQSTSSASTSLRGYGITLAVASNIGNTGIIVRNNDITMFHGRGINLTGGFPGIEVYGNNIYHTVAITAPVAIESAGIYFSTSSSPGAKIYSNYIYDLKYTNGTTSINGIQFVSSNATGTVPAFFNNRISIGDGITATTVPIYGFNYSSTTATYPYDVYFNSVLISGTATTGTANSAAFRKAAGNVFNLKNNIFYNARTNSAGTGTHWAIAVNNTTFTSIGNNDYYANGTGGVLGTTDGTTTGNKATLALWKAAVPADLNSVSQNPNYLAGLKIDTTIPTQLESGGTPVVYVTTDFEGNARNATTPDIGADEFVGILLDLSAPIIVYTPLLNTNSLAARNIVVNVTDPGSGVPIVAPGWPNLYWKKGVLGLWTAVTPTGVAGSDYTYSFGGGVATGDTVFYYVVAQDGSVPPNVGAYPSLGAGGFTFNPPAAATPPTTPSSYIISQAALAGNYTVGLTMFNQITGKNIYFEKVITKVMKEVDVEVPQEVTQYAKGQEPQSENQISFKPQTVKQLMEVEEISWIPMQNGQPYYGDLYVKKIDSPEFNYPVGTDGIYATITAAVADLNLRGVGGATTFLLNDASYTTGETYPIVIKVANEGNFPTATNTVTIKPNTGVTALVQGAAAAGQIFKILNSYVSIDGSNAGGTDRSLTIENTSATTPQVIVFGSTGTTPIVGNTLKNCIIRNGVTSSTAIVVSDGTAPGTAGYFNNITIQNNSIGKAYMGVYNIAVMAPGNGGGLLITGNDLNNATPNHIALVGLYVQGVDGATVSNNNIGNYTTTYTSNVTGVWFATGTVNSNISGNTIGPINITTAPPRGIVITSAVENANVVVNDNIITGMISSYSGADYGIYVFSTTSGVSILKNKISNIKNTSTLGYSAIGIALGSTLTAANITVANNFIWDVAAYGYGSTTTDNGYGINLLSGGGYNLYFNSVGLTTEQTLITGYPACLIINSAITTPASLDIRDNIFATFQNLGAQRYALLCNAANTVFSNINYNDWYSLGPNLGYIGRNRLNLDSLRAGTGQDLQSISGDPKFVSNTDLHINTLFNVVDAKALYLASVPTDIDGDARNVTTPDIGADEYIYVIPTVNDPTGVTASAISDTQIDVAFTPNTSSNNVVIVFNLDGVFTAPSGTPPAPGNSFAGGTLLYNGITSPYNHLGLTGSTTYYYKLFSYDGSIYSSGVATNATTNASPIAPPYAQDFEGTFPPTGWTNYGTKTWFQSTTGGIGGSKCASVSYAPAGTANLQMPSLVLPASPLYRIKFSWKDNDVFAMLPGENSKMSQKGKQNKSVKNPANGPEIALHDTTYFEISTNGGTTWTALAFLSSGSPQANYTEVIQNLNTYAGQTVSIRWRDVSDGTFSAYGTGLDNITVEEIPACPAPTGLTATGVTNNSANIGWSGATTVDIDYGTPGHPAGTGTIVNGVTANPYSLGGLTAQTSYDVYVRQDCGGSFSSWAGPLSFTTACDLVLAPWTEDFESGVFPPNCWSVTGAAGLWIRGSASGYATGIYSARANFYNVGSGSADLISVGYNASSLTNPILKFDWAYATYSGEVDQLDIYYSTNGGTTWTLLLAMPGGTNGILNPYNLVITSSFVPTAGQWSTQSLSLPSGTNRVKFTAISAFGNNLYVDNIKVEEAPALPVFSISPTSKNFGSVYVGSSSANQTFTITNTGAGTLTITSGNISIIGTDAGQFILTDANTYPINLTNGQTATVAVKFSPTSAGAKTASLQIVDNTAGSPHTAALSGVGTTPPTIPYSTDFEAFTVGQQLACQDPVNWSTWSNLPCSSEDAYISSNYAFSGTKSVVIAPNNDLVKPLLAQTTGKWSISFMSYIPTGKTGYFNTLGLFAGGSSIWGMECYFNAGGAGQLFGGSATATTFTWVPNSWKKVEVVVDLNLDLAEFWYGGTLVKSWQWTLGASGTGCPLQVDANDFFGATANDEMYLDNYSFKPFTNTFQLSVDVIDNWNMVSIPGLHPTDQNVNTWWAYRDLTANVFKFDGFYRSVTTAIPGLGYWMKHSGARTYNTGDEWPAGGIQVVPHDPIAGVTGWNMFGGYELSVSTANITTNPSGQQSGPVYYYGTGYQIATTLNPGYGYWISLLSNCQIIIPETIAKETQLAEWFPEDWGKVIITDAQGRMYTLYAVKGEVDLNIYQLPPAPPAGMFDMRFSSGRIAEDLNSAMQTIEMSGVTYPLTVRVEGMDIRLMDETGKTVNVNLKSGEDVVISDGTINKLMVSTQLIPEKYSLEQNYPNPFNPSTVIEFSLPENVGNVKLSIYNALGEKVAELVNTELVAGKYQYQWNAQNVATGMYIYELRTDKFVSVKKMLLLK